MLPPHDQHQREQVAERHAIDLLRYPSYKDCLKAYRLSPAITIERPENKPLTIQGSTVFEQRTVQKWLTSLGVEPELTHLASEEELLAPQYTAWLMTSYTSRYQAITAEADLQWLGKVATLALRHFLILAKYQALVHQGKDTYADPNVALVTTILLALQDWRREIPRLVHHIRGHDEQAQDLIRQLLDECDQHFADMLRLLQPRELRALLLGEMAQNPGEHPQSAQENEEEQRHE